MKQNKTKPRRYKVGDYRAYKDRDKIVIVYSYKEDGETVDEFTASFDRNHVGQMEAFLANPELVIAKLQKDLKSAETKEAVLGDLYRKSSDKVRNLRAELSRPGKKRVGDFWVRGDSENVKIGCTTITRKKFDQLAKLLK